MRAPQSLGIIGHGAFGSFLARIAKRFTPELEMRIYDREITPDGQTFYSIEDACQADVVVIAVSIRARSLERSGLCLAGTVRTECRANDG
jgi:prephenate dehydrogenase